MLGSPVGARSFYFTGLSEEAECGGGACSALPSLHFVAKSIFGDKITLRGLLALAGCERAQVTSRLQQRRLDVE
jgi:hypothetical protein